MWIVVASIVGLIMVLVGLVLWWPPRREASRASDLGAAVVGGALVAFVVMGLQVVAESRATKIEEAREKREKQREIQFQKTQDAQADKQALQMTLAFHSDLSSISLEGKNLTGLFLRGKKLVEADLDKTVLSKTKFSATDLSRATLMGARGEGTIFSDARMVGSLLSCSVFPSADFRSALLSEADMRGADLSTAALEGAVLKGAIYGASTKLPPGIDPRSAGMTLSPEEASCEEGKAKQTPAERRPTSGRRRK